MKKRCKYCGKESSSAGIKRHEPKCYLNPKNLRECAVCGKPVKGKAKTCSYSCSNTFFRSGEDNPNWKDSTYRSTCFAHHKKECIICGENKIVHVHHYDGNKNNNTPENLIPLCPTHHQYLHSRYKKLIFEQVKKYIEKASM